MCLVSIRRPGVCCSWVLLFFIYMLDTPKNTRQGLGLHCMIYSKFSSYCLPFFLLAKGVLKPNHLPTSSGHKFFPHTQFVLPSFFFSPTHFILPTNSFFPSTSLSSFIATAWSQSFSSFTHEHTLHFFFFSLDQLFTTNDGLE
jgi:hypothetical protein